MLMSQQLSGRIDASFLPPVHPYGAWFPASGWLCPVPVLLPHVHVTKVPYKVDYLRTAMTQSLRRLHGQMQPFC